MKKKYYTNMNVVLPDSTKIKEHEVVELEEETAQIFLSCGAVSELAPDYVPPKGAETQPPAQDPVPENIDLSKLNRFELVALAREAGIKNANTMKSEDILKAMKEVEEGKAKAESPEATNPSETETQTNPESPTEGEGTKEETDPKTTEGGDDGKSVE